MMRWVHLIPIFAVILLSIFFHIDDADQMAENHVADSEMEEREIYSAEPAIDKSTSISKMRAVKETAYFPPAPRVVGQLNKPFVAPLPFNTAKVNSPGKSGGNVKQTLLPLQPNAGVQKNISAPTLSPMPVSKPLSMSVPKPVSMPVSKSVSKSLLAQASMRHLDQPLSAGNKDHWQDEEEIAAALLDGLTTLEAVDKVGLDIEIAWPTTQNARQLLFQKLVNCHGLKHALLGESGRLYGDFGGLAARSPLLRQLEHGIDPRANQERQRLISRHHISEPARLVYLIDRKSDALLIGFLSPYIADHSRIIKVRGRYSLQGGEINVQNISVNDKDIEKNIILPSLGCLR